MPRVGFESTISAGERPKTYALDRVATGCLCVEIAFVIPFPFFLVQRSLSVFISFHVFFLFMLITVCGGLNRGNGLFKK